MLFLSTFTNRIDRKGRVSVPAPFRAVLASEAFAGVYAGVSMRAKCLECCGPSYFSKLHQRVAALDPFSPERAALENVVFAETQQLSFDAEGRTGLPPALIEAAGLSEEAVFVGKGEVFEIWSPAAYAKYRESARATVRKTFYEKGGQS